MFICICRSINPVSLVNQLRLLFPPNPFPKFRLNAPALFILPSDLHYIIFAIGIITYYFQYISYYIQYQTWLYIMQIRSSSAPVQATALVLASCCLPLYIICDSDYSTLLMQSTANLCLRFRFFQSLTSLFLSLKDQIRFPLLFNHYFRL